MPIDYEIFSTTDLLSKFESFYDNREATNDDDNALLLAVIHRLETLEKVEDLLE